MTKNVNSENNLNDIDLKTMPLTNSAIKFPKLATFLVLLLHLVTLLLPLVMILTFFQSAMNSQLFHWRIFILFLDVLVWWLLYLFSSITFAKLVLIILNLIHLPKEGVFEIDFKDRDYYFFCLRVSVKKFVFWIWNNFCFPWVSNFAFKVCDMRADFKSTLFDGWSDVEFIEYGNNMMLGQGASVSSCMILGNFLIVKKVIIGDHVVLGGNSIVAPGTIIGKSCTLGAFSVTSINQYLEPGWIYIGHPAQKFKEAAKNLGESKKTLKRRIVDNNTREILELD